MIFSFIFFVIGIVGIVVLYIRHRADLATLEGSLEISSDRYRVFFVLFMKSVVEGVSTLWRVYVWGHLLRFAEKRLHFVRIIALKIDRHLFHATRRLRTAAKNNENDLAETETKIKESEDK